MNQQPCVAENLELLADFGPDISIIWMKPLQFAGEGVGVGGRERRFAEAADGVEHVQRPAALGDGNFIQRFDATELRADFGCRGNLAFGDDGDAGFGGDTLCVNIKNRPVSVSV